MLRLQAQDHNLLSVAVGQGLNYHPPTIRLKEHRKPQYPGLPPTNKYPYLAKVHKDMLIGTNCPPLYHREGVFAVIDIYQNIG
ncbi:unnamed protein product, partial [marine sediment metagenome]